MRLLLLPALVSGLQLATFPPVSNARTARVSTGVWMQEVEASIEAVSADVETSMDMAAAVPEKNERFKAISLNALDEWAEKFPRLKTEVRDIKLSSLIFPFKASPYLVEELIDWEMEGDIKDDPFYRLVFPTMEMLAPHHRAKLETARAHAHTARPACTYAACIVRLQHSDLSAVYA